MTGALTIAESSGEPTVHWTPDQVHVLQTELFNGITSTQLALFAQVCKRTGLDPFAKQIYAIARGGKLTIQTSIDGYRLTAQRSGRYNGQTPPEWYDGERWHDVWLEPTYPKAARIGVYIKGADQPTYGVAAWSEYATDPSSKSGAMWKKMPATMIAKCAEALALRKCFPAELAGVYTDVEMQQAGDTADADTSDALTDEQVAVMRDLCERAGIDPAIAEVRIANLTADRFDEAVASMQQRIDEQETVEAEVVE